MKCRARATSILGTNPGRFSSAPSRCSEPSTPSGSGSTARRYAGTSFCTARRSGPCCARPTSAFARSSSRSSGISPISNSLGSSLEAGAFSTIPPLHGMVSSPWPLGATDSGPPRGVIISQQLGERRCYQGPQQGTHWQSSMEPVEGRPERGPWIKGRRQVQVQGQGQELQQRR